MIAEKATLHAALKAVLPVTKGSKTIPILNHVVLARVGGEMVIRGSNLDQELNVAIKVDFGDDFEDVAVPASTLAQFVEHAPGTEIHMAFGRTGSAITSVSLSSGRSRLRLLTLPAADFPVLETGPLEHGFTIDGQILAKALKAVIYAASVDASRTYLHGAFIEPTDAGLGVVATDGHRIERRLIPMVAFDGDEALAGLPPTIIPTDTVKRLISLIVEGKDIVLQLSRSKLRASVGNVTMLSKLVEGQFPAYQRVVPQRGDKRASFNVSDLEAARARVVIASDQKVKRVLHRFSAGLLVLTVTDHDVGEAQDQIEIEGDAEIDIVFDGKYLEELLANCGAGKLEICMTAPGDPTTLSAPGDMENYTILMPTRL